MSVQRWSPAGDAVHRFFLCGHTFLEAELVADAQGELTCAVCHRHAQIHSPIFGWQSFVPTADLTWENVRCIRKDRVKSKASGTIDTLQDLVREFECSAASLVHLQNRHLASGPGSSSATELIVIVSETFGSVVTCGSIAVPPCGVLLLHGQGAAFEDVTFSGGAIVCAGPNFFGTFRRCTFRCDVSVVHGARARFSACTFASQRFGLVASGCATYATLAACFFQRCPTGIVAELGAAVSADATHIHHTVSAVIVNDPGSHVALTGCTTHGGADGHTGIRVYGGRATAHSCRVAACRAPLFAFGPTAFIDVRDFYAEKFNQGACAQVHARVAVARPTFDMHGPANRTSLGEAPVVGVVSGTGGGGANVQIERCRFDGLQAECQGWLVSSGSRLAALRCEAECKVGVVTVVGAGSRAMVQHCLGRGQYACCVESAGCTLALQACTLTSSENACVVKSGARVSAADCMLTGPDAGLAGAAVEVSGGSSVALLRCVLRRAPIALHAVGSVAIIKHCHVFDPVLPRRPKPPALSVTPRPSDSGFGYQLQGGRLDVSGGSVAGCFTGVVVGPATADAPEAALRAAAELSMEDVTFRNCACSVHMHADSALEATRCHFQGVRSPSAQLAALHAQSFAIGLAADGPATIADCMFSDYFRGVFVPRAGRAVCCVTVRGSTFRNMLPSSVGIQSQARLHVEECGFVQCPQGVIIKGGEVALRKCRFGPDVGGGVTCEEGSLSAVGCRFRDCDLGITAQDDADVSVQDCEFTSDQGNGMVGQAIRAQGERFSVNVKRMKCRGGLAALFAKCPTGATAASVKLVVCEITATLLAMHLEGHGLQGSMLRCDVSRCSRGVLVQRSATARVRHGSMAGCQVGVFAGAYAASLVEYCELCGLAGTAATKAAFRHAGGPTRPGARCEHHGVRTRATISGVKIADSTQSGITVERFGNVEVSDVELTGNAIGVTEHVTGERSTFSGCVVSPGPGQAATSVFSNKLPGREIRAADQTIPGIVVV